MADKLRAIAVKARDQAKAHTPTATQLAGLGLFTTGAFLVAPFFGFMVAGVLVCVVGWALDN